jgi:hypothetical protein
MRVITIAAVVAFPFAALADEAEDKFREAMKLKEKGDSKTACELFRQAWELNKDAVGSILNVAQCAEDAGHAHTALVHFRRLQSVAKEHSFPEYLTKAEDHIAKLEKTVPRLALSFDDEPDAATKLTIDDEVYEITNPNARTLEVNAGSIHIVVAHPGRVAYEATVEMKLGDVKGFHVRKLAAPVRINRTRRNVGLAVTAIGGVTLVTGALLAAVAHHNYIKMFDPTNEDPTMPNVLVVPCSNWDTESGTTMFASNPIRCDPYGLQRTQSARTLGDVATGTLVVGGVVTVVGAYLWLFAPKAEQPEKVTIVPLVAPDRAGFLAVGRF